MSADKPAEKWLLKSHVLSGRVSELTAGVRAAVVLTHFVQMLELLLCQLEPLLLNLVDFFLGIESLLGYH